MTTKLNRIGIICGPSSASGPYTWKTGLAESLREKGLTVIEFNNDLKQIFLNVYRLVGVDVVHAYCLTVNSILLLLVCLLFRKKIVFTLHGNYFVEKNSKRGITKIFFVPMHNFILKAASFITFPTLFIKKAIEQKIDLGNKTRVIPNGIHYDYRLSKNIVSRESWRSKKTFQLLEVTGFNYLEKAMGIVPLIEAVNIFNDKYEKKIVLMILGKGKYFDKFSLYESRNINFLGHQDPTPFYAKTDICVHSTFLDNMPYSLIEAMCYAKPIIATTTGGIPEFVDETGLCKPNKNDLFKKIVEFVNNYDVVLKNIKNNNKKVASLDWSKVANDFVEIYEKVI